MNRRVTVELLEDRRLLAVITVDAHRAVRDVNPQLLGVNVNWWDTQLPTTRTRQMVQEAGLNFFRFPGGSSSNEYHFNDPPSYNGRGTAATFANFIASVGGEGVVTLNYGTASPQEGAAWLAYLNANVGDTTVIGTGPQWSNSANAWVQKDWRTAGYWASLRAAQPLAQNDGLNFLRVSRPQPFGLHYFEIGNEMYGTWEVDRHGQGGVPGAPHDPATYVNFARRFADYAAQIDPTISIGVNSGSVGTDAGWTARVLREGQAIGFVPGFISDHLYMQAPGQESDTYLLRQTVSSTTGHSATDPKHWGLRAAGYRSLLSRTLGAAASGVELLATEYNSVYSNPGKQTTSLVNGLFTADSIGGLLQTEYNGANFWDLRNGFDTGNNNSASLYGWRQGGDYGLLGTGSGPLPATGTYVPYPTYFAHQLASRLVLGGDEVVRVRTDDANVSAYAVRQSDGDLHLLVINKHPTADLAQQVTVNEFRPAGSARVWQYGKAEDTAQSRTTDGRAALTTSTLSFSLNTTGFSFTFPSYSMTVIELSPAPAVVGRHVFYNNSAFDGRDPAQGAADDAAIATDKRSLSPGQSAAFENLTSYSRGINGIMLDVANLPRDPVASDFVFETAAGPDATTWGPAPLPSSITRRPGAGVGGSDRVTLVWPDGAVRNAWLRVTFTPALGVPASDRVTTFGNLAGDTANPAGAAPAVTASDVIQTRARLFTDAPITSRYDFNRDGRVTGTDVILARRNLSERISAGPFAPPASPAPLSVARVWDEDEG